MPILVFYTATEIITWLINEPLESAPAHIANGYPQLADGYSSGSVLVAVIQVDEADAYRPDLFEVVDGAVVKKGA